MVHMLDFPFDELPVGDFTVKGKAVIEFTTSHYRTASVCIDAVYDKDGSDVTKFVPIENDDKDVVRALYLKRWGLVTNEVRHARTRLAQNV